MKQTGVLAALIASTVVLSAQHTIGPVDRPLSWPGDLTSIAVHDLTPDGRGALFQDSGDKTFGDLQLRDLQTGSVRRVTALKEGFVTTAAVSKTGKFVAFLQSGLPIEQQVCVTSLAGKLPATSRVLLKGKRYRPVEWSADDAQLLVRWDVHGPSDGEHVGIVTIPDGRLRTLKTTKNPGLGGLSLAPDAGLIAFDYAPDARPPASGDRSSGALDYLDRIARLDHDIYLLPTDGGREIRLEDRDASDSVIGWVANGRELIVLRQSGTGRGIWAVPIGRTGQTGPARVLVADFQGRPLALSAGGDLLYEAGRVERSQDTQFRILERLFDQGIRR